MKFCLWISGLPGSGKSTIARELENSLSKICVDTITLNLDEIRKIITPRPSYTNEERDIVYGALAYMAKLLVVTGCINVVIDATGHRRAYRNMARTLIPEFAEVYIKCPLEICQEREASRDAGNIETDLYRKARSGHLKGGFPGVTAVYEESENPEVVVNSDILDPSESAELIMNYARSRWLRTHFLHADQ